MIGCGQKSQSQKLKRQSTSHQLSGCPALSDDIGRGFPNSIGTLPAATALVARIARMQRMANCLPNLSLFIGVLLLFLS